MEKKDFKRVTKAHVEACEKMIRQAGECDDIECFNCPFHSCNWNHKCYETDFDALLKNAEEFVEKFKEVTK